MNNLEQYKSEINNSIVEIFNKYIIQDSKIKDAMLYSLLNGGKRLRPILFLSLIDSLGYDYHKYINIAVSIEMIHCYSLIHDDLPAIDNDNLRRGLPTCHVKYDEPTAILAGDALLNDSFYILSLSKINADILIKIISTVSLCSGHSGMIYGQVLDIDNNSVITLEQLENIYYNKTGKLLEACFVSAALITSNDINIDLYSKLAYKLGLLYQIKDDLLEVTSSQEIIGKSVNSDINNNKTTIIKLLGFEESINYSNELYISINEIIEQLQLKDTSFYNTIEHILSRKY